MPLNLSLPVSFSEISKGVLQTEWRHYWSWLIFMTHSCPTKESYHVPVMCESPW